MYLGTKCKNTYTQGQHPVYHCFLNRGMCLSAIVAMTCEGVIGIPFCACANTQKLCVQTQMKLTVQQKLLGVFLEINEIYAHARTVDTGPSFPPPQRPGYEATPWRDVARLHALHLSALGGRACRCSNIAMWLSESLHS